MYRILKNVPMPPKRPCRKPATTKYPFALMQVGDSFIVRCAASNVKKEMTRIRALATKSQKALNCKFALRPLETGVGVWRVQ